MEFIKNNKVIFIVILLFVVLVIILITSTRRRGEKSIDIEEVMGQVEKSKAKGSSNLTRAYVERNADLLNLIYDVLIIFMEHIEKNLPGLPNYTDGDIDSFFEENDATQTSRDIFENRNIIDVMLKKTLEYNEQMDYINRNDIDRETLKETDNNMKDIKSYMVRIKDIYDEYEQNYQSKDEEYTEEMLLKLEGIEDDIDLAFKNMDSLRERMKTKSVM